MHVSSVCLLIEIVDKYFTNCDINTCYKDTLMQLYYNYVIIEQHDSLSYISIFENVNKSTFNIPLMSANIRLHKTNPTTFYGD